MAQRAKRARKLPIGNKKRGRSPTQAERAEALRYAASKLLQNVKYIRDPESRFYVAAVPIGDVNVLAVCLGEITNHDN
jgi:hypothetical protein